MLMTMRNELHATSNAHALRMNAVITLEYLNDTARPLDATSRCRWEEMQC
ncbi:MAG: hypothetical protein IJS69_04075 [Selenomonadaceae bacterium]|nr:hypothetical protein [Selenomonadaceae bacterium]